MELASGTYHDEPCIICKKPIGCAPLSTLLFSIVDDKGEKGKGCTKCLTEFLNAKNEERKAEDAFWETPGCVEEVFIIATKRKKGLPGIAKAVLDWFFETQEEAEDMFNAMQDRHYYSIYRCALRVEEDVLKKGQ